MNQGSLLKAAVLGGLLAGIASSVPWISLLCCGWAMGGGAFAAWVVISDSDARVGVSRCAAAGFVSGIWAGLIAAPLSGVLNLLVHGEEKLLEQSRLVASMMGSGAEGVSPEMMEAVMRGSSFADINAWSVVAILLSACIFSLLGLLGGLIGAALFRPKVVSAGVPLAPVFDPAQAIAATKKPQEERGPLAPDELPELPPRDEEPEA